MFADPQSVTINAVATSLPRTKLGTTDGVFTSADGKTVMTIKQNSTAKRFRREARLTVSKIAADPLTAVNQDISTSVYIVIDEPKWGFSDTDLGYYKDALTLWLTGGGQMARFLGSEF
jgi:hypothetical protein